MYIVVVGAGKVGYYLTKALISDGEEVLVIEKDRNRVEAVVNQLGGTAIQGDGAEIAILDEAGVERADVVVAVTGHDEDNLVIAQVAKKRYNVPRTIARVNNPRNRAVFDRLGIDGTVSATERLLSLLQQEIPSHPIVHLLSLENDDEESGVQVVELQLSADAPFIGRKVSELALPAQTVLAAVIRRENASVPSGDTTLEADDKLVFVTAGANEGALRLLCIGRAAQPAR